VNAWCFLDESGASKRPHGLSTLSAQIGGYFRVYKGNVPITIPVESTMLVPGVPEKSGNLYDFSQILSWLTGNRRDLQEQLAWREGIPGVDRLW